MRRALPVAGVVLGVVLGTATPAFAHGARSIIDLTTTTAAGGQLSVAAAVSFVDNDPVTDAKLVAQATSGQTHSSILMRPSAKPGRYVGSVHLAPGSWQVTVRSVGTVDDAHEGIGVASTTVQIAAPAHGSSSLVPVVGAGAGGAVLLAGLGMGWGARRRRTRRDAKPAESPSRVTSGV
jgi:hypothetical protein